MKRTFPFSPRSATSLAVGDLVPVQGFSGNWACLQVLELQPRKRVNFVAALLPWRGTSPPGPNAVAGLVPLRRALTRMDIFTQGGLQVTGNVAPSDSGQERWYGPSYVGKRTRVWGWKRTVLAAQEVADTGWPLADAD
ncbi:hypothetical protein OL239_10830 [Arthrobacter sp. ATA002]|uniref:hypothetical protein n=1 Tax=Arthrobacter sp. ATA002 TaxID=2991715 RepID=UPI0022A72800|nr:hypothetical protein [Arthrobacter sp. ATA002]WAP50541.1 hypothetical protein OL239_10830 [Arthrobacter sp. ATA002]